MISLLLVFILSASADLPAEASTEAGTIAIHAEKLMTMGPAGAIEKGVVVVKDGRIVSVGKESAVTVPSGTKEIYGKVVVPGFIDAHNVLGLNGMYNVPGDQDADERTGPVQPELRAIDGFNPREELLRFVLERGTTTILTGPGTANVVAGQAAIYKTDVELGDKMLVRAPAAMIYNLGEDPKKTYQEKHKAPTTRMAVAWLVRKSFQDALTYRAKKQAAAKKPEKERKPVDYDAQAEAVLKVLDGEIPALVTAQRESDIDVALRLMKEFKMKMWLAGAADAYLARERIHNAGVPVLVGPVLERPYAVQTENASLQNASLLADAGVPIAFQSAEEGYVPKGRAILWEAALAAANDLGPERALTALTIGAAKILGIADRVGSLEVGKDADVVVCDGDPFEYRSHVTAVLVSGRLSYEGK